MRSGAADVTSDNVSSVLKLQQCCSNIEFKALPLWPRQLVPSKAEMRARNIREYDKPLRRSCDWTALPSDGALRGVIFDLAVYNEPAGDIGAEHTGYSWVGARP